MTGTRDLFPLCFKRKTPKRRKNWLVMIDNEGNYLEELRIMLPFNVFLRLYQSGKRSFAPDVMLLGAEKILHKLYGIDF